MFRWGMNFKNDLNTNRTKNFNLLTLELVHKLNFKNKNNKLSHQ
jgi:hypothetical protein